jgi:head-tail adaptor
MLQHKQRIGSLDREVTFIKPIIETGESNADNIIGWELIDNYHTVSAAKSEKEGTVYQQSERLTFTQLTDWVIRWRGDLNVTMRLVYSTQVYEITNIVEADDARRRFLKITTKILDNTFFT